MKKNVFGRKFKRDTNERKALFKNLLTSLVLKERIRTTEAKAKAIKGAADKLITKAKKGGQNVYKSLHPDVNQEAVVKLVEDIVKRFSTRQGGYTRIIKIGKRRVADNAEMVYLEWTERATSANLELKTSSSAKASADKKNLKKTKKVKKVVSAKGGSSSGRKKIVKAPKTETVKPVINKKEEKVQKPGIFKRLITRQKKGQ